MGMCVDVAILSRDFSMGKFDDFFSAKKTYVGGLLFNSIGMTIMALTRARISVIVFSATAGVMYSTLFTMPYLLVAHYHSNGTVSETNFIL